MIRVLLVDDQPLLRSGFRALLEIEDDIEVVAEAADGSEGLARPDSSSRTSSRKTSCTPYASPPVATPCWHRRSPAS
jgi:hypothetical protein